MPRRTLLAGAAAAVLLFGGLATGAYAYSTHVAYQVLVDGKLMGLVASAAEVPRAVAALAGAQQFPDGMDATPDQAVTTSPQHWLWMPPVLDQGALTTLLAKLLTFHATGAAIIVDGKRVVTLARAADAQAVVAKVRDDAVSGMDTDAGTAKITDLKADQTVEVKPVVTTADQLVSPAQALAILERGTDLKRTYQVQAGDSLWKIASTSGMTESQLRQANPQIKDPRLIHVGDTINLIVPTPYITYSARIESTYDQHIPFQIDYVRDDSLWPWQRKVVKPGEEGLKRVTEVVVRKAGKLVSRRVVKSEVLKPPTTAVVALGSKAVPDRGTGSFVWPIADGGVITSPFGWRRIGFHDGIDIAVPLGTPVHAADSGTVIWASWDGGYGNLIEIDHGGGRLVTMYAHLSRILVQVGDVVEKNQVIGLSGSTGHSTGPHLHFQVMKDGQAVDPTQMYK